MLRIGVHDDNDATNFTVEGKLTAPASIELEKCWQALIAANPSRRVVVKLAAVTFVDSESKELLARMRRKGVRLVPAGCLMTAIVAQIETDVVGSHAEL
jgi:anti-anti-sigma regulatory factor